VAICDFDVHHGNGTEDLVAGDERILFCSTFQYPLFPGYYGADVPGQRVNCPLPPGSGGDALRAAVSERWLAELAAFAPELVIVSAGFDAHRADPVGGLEWDEDDFRWVTERIREVAEASAAGRVVSVLEGGYDLPALGRSAAAHVAGLML
jgi:acetoin utilization deacetylase AcuC-like enzyme